MTRIKKSARQKELSDVIRSEVIERFNLRDVTVKSARYEISFPYLLCKSSGGPGNVQLNLDFYCGPALSQNGRITKRYGSLISYDVLEKPIFNHPLGKDVSRRVYLNVIDPMYVKIGPSFALDYQGGERKEPTLKPKMTTSPERFVSEVTKYLDTIGIPPKAFRRCLKNYFHSVNEGDSTELFYRDQFNVA
ncbi:hypothetical protein HN385_04275 [archaeon]|jgi:hypothetical protein|nr:hypothetical protein [archaeon]MBT3450459.1 hypothetical protein [archaeon]MBT6868984.1 hypothetical protein [archaeon]MBT7193250.1 hypothetical protein [archaeon]MBT7380105.1 hypothetical protein [archaeon]